MNTFALFIVIGLILWIGGTLYAVRGIEEPEYSVAEKKKGYEIRAYAPYIVAEIDVSRFSSGGLSEGFRILAAYIFGGNTAKASISMTAPVLESRARSIEIAMTTPVMDTISETGAHTVAFTMPKQYTLETLPKPLEPKIRLRQVPQTKKAVLRYSGYATVGQVEKKKKLLLELLTHDGYVVQGEIVSAQYNPPLSFPFLRRNEVMVDIE